MALPVIITLVYIILVQNLPEHILPGVFGRELNRVGRNAAGAGVGAVTGSGAVSWSHNCGHPSFSQEQWCLPGAWQNSYLEKKCESMRTLRQFEVSIT